MKRTATAAIAMAATVILLAACGKTDNGGLKTTPPEVRFYGVENAKIEYVYSGAASGKKTAIIANYGMYQYTEDKLNFKLGEQTVDQNRIDITDDSVVYVIDMKAKTGSKSLFDYAGFRQYTKDFKPEEKQNFQQSYILRNGGKKVGTEEVLGHTCDVYEMSFMGVSVALWNGLTMRSRIIMHNDTMMLTATSIDTDFEPTMSMFQPPKDVKITDVTKMLPAGHPPVNGGEGQGEMPAGHPSMEGSEQGQGEMPAGHPSMGGSPHGEGKMPPAHQQIKP